MQKNKYAAFSLIEVLIAWLIVSTAVAGLLGAEVHALRLTRQSFDRSLCGEMTPAYYADANRWH